MAAVDYTWWRYLAWAIEDSWFLCVMSMKMLSANSEGSESSYKKDSAEWSHSRGSLPLFYALYASTFHS